MSRLTEMCDDKSGYFMKNECPMEHSYAYFDFEEDSKCIEKLGQLEDIEEELGIELITFHNLLRCGGYYRNTDKNEIIFDYPRYESDVEQYVLGDIRNFVLLKEEDYGKTWALTKEELICKKD